MISSYDVRKYAEKHEDCWFSVNEDNIIDKETGETVCTMKVMVQMMREKLHCDFETIYSDCLDNYVIRCKQCGTVIFGSDDCYNYEPNLTCPTCSDYKTGFNYWTAKEISQDEDKQKAIEEYKEMARYDKEAYKRRKKRNGKYDWEIAKCSFKISSNKKLYLELQCDNLFLHKLKGLRLDIYIGYKDSMGYILKKHFVLPLSWSNLKLRIYIWNKRRKGEKL